MKTSCVSHVTVWRRNLSKTSLVVRTLLTYLESYTDADLWSVLEVNIGIIVSCLMTCGPLLKFALVRVGVTSNSSGGRLARPGLITIGSRGTAKAKVNRNTFTEFTDLESVVPPADARGSQVGLTGHAQQSVQADSQSIELDKIYVRKDIKVEERDQGGLESPSVAYNAPDTSTSYNLFDRFDRSDAC